MGLTQGPRICMLEVLPRGLLHTAGFMSQIRNNTERKTQRALRCVPQPLAGLALLLETQTVGPALALCMQRYPAPQAVERTQNMQSVLQTCDMGPLCDHCL